MKYLKESENWWDEESQEEFYKKIGGEEEIHPWDRIEDTDDDDYDDYHSYNKWNTPDVKSDSDESVLAEQIDDTLRSNGVNAYTEAISDTSIDILIVLDGGDFGYISKMMDLLKTTLTGKDFYKYTTSVRIWKSTSGDPLLIVELKKNNAYKPWKK